jgi:hypothetical protein
MSDFQEICVKMDHVNRNEFIYDDNHFYGPSNYGQYLGKRV